MRDSKTHNTVFDFFKTYLYHRVAIRIGQRGFQPGKTGLVELIELKIVAAQLAVLHVNLPVPLGNGDETATLFHLLRVSALLQLALGRVSLVQVVQNLRENAQR